MPPDWSAIRQQLLLLPHHAELSVPATAVRPELAGAVRSIGLPRGQAADFRFPAAADCTGLHVHELPDGSYRAHLDAVHPACGVLPHLQADAPATLLALSLVVGLGVGLVLQQPLAGAVLGLVGGFGLAAGGRRQLAVVKRLQTEVRRHG